MIYLLSIFELVVCILTRDNCYEFRQAFSRTTFLPSVIEINNFSRTLKGKANTLLCERSKSATFHMFGIAAGSNRCNNPSLAALNKAHSSSPTMSSSLGSQNKPKLIEESKLQRVVLNNKASDYFDNKFLRLSVASGAGYLFATENGFLEMDQARSLN